MFFVFIYFQFYCDTFSPEKTRKFLRTIRSRKKKLKPTKTFIQIKTQMKTSHQRKILFRYWKHMLLWITCWYFTKKTALVKVS